MSSNGSSVGHEDTAEDFLGFESGFPGFSRSLNQSAKGPGGSPDNFSKELSRLQEEQIYFTRKIEKENKRKETVEKALEDATKKLRHVQDLTKNGSLIRDHDMLTKKHLGRLEHHLQMSKIKLSVAKNENVTLKKKVMDRRRDKLLHLQILNDLTKETFDARRRLKTCQKDILTCNEKKHKAKIGITAIKNQMLKDMEAFSHQMTHAKQCINVAQTTIISAMREKMLTANVSRRFSPMPQFTMDRGENLDELMSAKQAEQISLLGEAGFKAAEELGPALDASEEVMFLLYNETQIKEEEVERIDVENKHLEMQVESQLSRLHALEGHHEKVKQELETHIQALRSQINKYDLDYARNMEILGAVLEPMQGLLQNVANDEEAADQQLISTGLTDRNVDDFLGLIEQRIDDLIQMSKAANHQHIRRDDFMKMAQPDKSRAFRAPHLPSLEDDNDEEDETVKLHPINISVLKELMAKKLERSPRRGRHHKVNDMGMSPSVNGMRSRQSSALSLRSVHSSGSQKSLPSL
ncbi:hypothetical protein B484DRAFT_400319 [Ochromonadaceae sp. CCMP2298]|nr:hypothetical protein B484DRAFT_400319 [Ochromonadaceae sp. CCMP2298]